MRAFCESSGTPYTEMSSKSAGPRKTLGEDLDGGGGAGGVSCVLVGCGTALGNTSCAEADANADDTMRANRNTVASEAGKSRLSLVDSSIYVSAVRSRACSECSTWKLCGYEVCYGPWGSLCRCGGTRADGIVCRSLCNSRARPRPHGDTADRV